MASFMKQGEGKPWWERLEIIANRWSGFSLEKRLEWQHLRDQSWRIRILPNKNERFHYRFESYAESAEAAITLAWDYMVAMDKAVNKPKRKD